MNIEDEWNLETYKMFLKLTIIGFTMMATFWIWEGAITKTLQLLFGITLSLIGMGNSYFLKKQIEKELKAKVRK